MPESIKSGDSGYVAKVDKDKRLWVEALSTSAQQGISHRKKSAFQLLVPSTSLSSGTVVVAHIKNTSTDKSLVFTYIRHQTVGASGGTAFPNASNYFSIRFNRTYSSGGSLLTPVNMNVGSGKTSPTTIYGTNPTLAGTATEVDRWHTNSDGEMYVYNKNGALILPPNQTIEFAYIGDHTSGIVNFRASFFLVEAV